MHHIYIMASERSGTNLLRKILGAHSEISGPPPPHLFKHFFNILPYYGDLNISENFEKLVEDVISLTQVENSHDQWKFNINKNEVIKNIQHKNLTNIIISLYDLYTYKEQKKGWVCKENNLFDFAFNIKYNDPKAKFIYLVRDGRDYALSVKKTPAHHNEIYFIASEWKEEQKKALRVYQELTNYQSVILLRYEDLLSNPEENIKSLCLFLNLNYENNMLNFHQLEDTQSEARKTEFWQNLDKPLKFNNQNKFLKKFKKKEIKLFEIIGGKELKMLGYQLIFPPHKQKLNKISLFFYLIKDKFAILRQKKVLLKEPGRKNKEKKLKEIKRNLESPGKYS